MKPVMKFSCPTCGARVGEPCREDKKRVDPHPKRVQKMQLSRRYPTNVRRGMIR